MNLAVRMAVLVTLLVGMSAFTPQNRAEAAGVVGTGNPASCTEAALDVALAGGGAVSFNCGPGSHTIAISSEKVILADTAIDGGAKITLDGQGQTRHFWVANGVTLALTGITLTGGNGTGASDSGRGGAIFTQYGLITVTASTLSDNHADISGGAIRVVSATVTVKNSTINGNSADRGGAIRSSSGGTVTIDGSTLSQNSATDGDGGGINASGFSTVSIANSTIGENSATGDGGGIHAGSISSVSLINSTVSGNTANRYGGGINSSSGTTTIGSSTISGNTANIDGGGISTSGGTTTIDNSTISGNTAHSKGGGISTGSGTIIIDSSTISGNIAHGKGGGISRAAGSFKIINSTISGNSADSGGGGVFTTASGGALTIIDSTISGNSATLGGGIQREIGNVRLQNTIIANSSSGGNCSGAINSLDFNLSDDGTCSLDQGNDLPNTPANLTPLGNYGGPTQTHHPLLGSAAIDSATCVTTADQRGLSRPQGLDCDRGSVEAIPPIELTTLCASYYTGQVSSPLNGSCLSYQQTISLPAQQSYSFCINRYTGRLSYSFGRPCPPGQIEHVIPTDGDLLVCVSRYTGAVRQTSDPAYCSFNAERPAFISGQI